MKKLLSLIVALFAVLPASAYSFYLDGIYYYTLSDNTVAVTYKNYYNNSYSGNIAIPETVTYNGVIYSVTEIGTYAFRDCSGLTKVEISDIAAWCGIDFYASTANPLYYAHHLYLNGDEVTDLVIPNSVTSLGSSCFYGCSGLTSVSIPKSVTKIGEDCFNGCSGLTSVSIPNSVTSIGDH